jgi:hypothetical protein
MGRPRKPPQLHVVEGTYRKDRHGPLPSPLAHFEPLGDAPADWQPAGKMLWHEIGAQIPLGVASRHDRVAFEIFVRLVIAVRADHNNCTPAMASQIRAYCGLFGMTPSDRAKFCQPPAEGATDPLTEYLT